MVTTFNSEADQPEDVVRRTAYIRTTARCRTASRASRSSPTAVSTSAAPCSRPGSARSSKRSRSRAARSSVGEPEPSGFACPCHGGAYDLEGNRVAGPPVRALDRYEYSIVNGNLTLGQLFSVGEVTGTGADAEMTVYKHQDPGTHVDGLSQYLYPIIP